MKISVDVPDYDGDGLDVIWEDGAKCTVHTVENQVVLSANRKGLISLAKQMLYLAYYDLPFGSHIHYDNFFCPKNFEDMELVIHKEDGGEF